MSLIAISNEFNYYIKEEEEIHNRHRELYLEIYSVSQLITKLYDKRDEFNFPIVNFLIVSY